MKCRNKKVVDIIQQKKYGGQFWSNIIETYKIIYKEYSYLNLLNIYYHITYKLKSYRIAVRNIINKIDSLKYFPYRGATYSNKYNRFIIYKNFLIFYEIQENKKYIIINRIIHKNVNL